MADVQTFQQLYDLAKAAAILRSQGKLGETSFSDGFMLDILNGIPALLGEEAERVALELHRKTFFGTAEGSFLDTLASDHFGLSRQAAVAAIGSVTFTRPSSVPGNVDIPTGTILSTSDGTRFTTDLPRVMTGLTSTVPVTAVETGVAGNVLAATITTIVFPLTDATITVSNPAIASGGLTAETDAAFRARILAFFQTIRRGTALALATGARGVAGVVTASVDETDFPPTVYIADITGTANATLEAAVVAELDNWRAAGVPVNVLGATVVNQDVSATLTFLAGFDTSDARDLAIDTLIATVNALTIGETLYRSALIAAAKTVEGVLDVVFTEPAGDVVPTASQVLRTDRTRVVVI